MMILKYLWTIKSVFEKKFECIDCTLNYPLDDNK